MEADNFARLVNDFISQFPPPASVDETVAGAGKPGELMLKRHTPSVVAYALGYSTTRTLERFLAIVDTRGPEDALRWDLRQQRAWVKANVDMLPFEEGAIFLDTSRPSGRSSQKFEIAAAWQSLVRLFDWGSVFYWGPGMAPSAQKWRMERLQLLYLVTEVVARAEGDALAQAFLLGRHPLLAAAPLLLISSSGREEAEEILFALHEFFSHRYGGPS